MIGMRTRNTRWAVVIFVFFVVLPISAIFVSRGGKEETIWFGDRRYSAREIFPDPTVAELAEAATKESIGDMDRLISNGVNLNYIGKFDYAPIMWAIETGSLKGCQELLAHGARLDIQSHHSMSAMALASGPASGNGFLELALKHGGNPDFAEADSGDTPLFFAIRSGEVQRVEMLIKAGANVNARNNRQVTPLIECAVTTEYKCALMLLRNGADYHLKDFTNSDFPDAMRFDRRPPWWMPSYWWRKRVVEYLGNANNSVRRGKP